MNWSYGVTTCPSRRGDLLPRTLDSLARGGFDRPRLFVDGDRPDEWWESLCARRGLQATYHWPKLHGDLPPKVGGGCLANWTLALWELYLREPKADRFAVFQDDLLSVRNLRAYLERSPWPGKGYLNLYTFSTGNELVTAGKRGWVEACLLNPPESNPGLLQAGRGALGLVFDRDALLALLSSRPFAEKRLAACPLISNKKVDGGVVNAMNLAGFREYVHAPSLLMHSGRESSIGNRAERVWGVAKGWPGEGFDALDLLC